MPRTRHFPPGFPPFGKNPPRPGERPPKPPIPAAVANLTGLLLVRASHRGHDCFLRALEPLGLHIRHMPVLHTLEAQGPQSQAQMTEQTWIDRTTMVALIDELEELGIVERAKDPRDRRAYLVQFTPKGRALLEQVSAAHQAAEDALLEPLSPEERQTLRGLLTRLIEADEAECESS